jgi:hypothetical protein
MFRRNPGALVVDLAAQHPLGGFRFEANADDDPAARGRMAHRVVDDVLEDLDQPLAIGERARQVGRRFDRDADAALAHQRLASVDRLRDQFVHVDRLQLGRQRPAILEQVVHQLAEAIHLAAQGPQVGLELLGPPEAGFEGVERGGDAEQRIAHLVRDAGHQGAHRGHRLLSAQRLLEPDDLGHVARHDHVALTYHGCIEAAGRERPGAPGGRILRGARERPAAATHRSRERRRGRPRLSAAERVQRGA